MPAPNLQQSIQEVPLKMVGGNKFGRFDKISVEQTWNMIVSDDALMPYAGWAVAAVAGGSNEGRGIYVSTVENFLLAVIGNQVYRFTSDPFNPDGPLIPNSPAAVGQLDTSTGDVFMAENNAKQILITDGIYAYIYDYLNDVFYSSKAGSAFLLTFPFTASGYCSFQDGRFIVAINGTQQWVLSAPNNGLTWSPAASSVGEIQSKPGFIQAALPMPGGGNNLLVFGSNVAESWQDVGAALFPYQRNSTFNIDYGCLNPSSIAELENFVVWLAANEQSGPVIMYTQGSGVKSISTDGINFKLSELTNPSNCEGFLFKQDGHLIYQITFPDDNLSYAYDFNTELFFTITDEELDYHPARQVVFFNNDYYFVSLNGGNVYRFGTQYTTASYEDEVEKIIPRIRITPPLRMPSQRYFIGKSVGFTIENGLQNNKTTIVITPGHDGTDLTTETPETLITEGGDIITTEFDEGDSFTYVNYSSVVDLSISRDGGESFGSSSRLNMNETGKRKSRFIWQRLGIVNDVTFQFRFSGYTRFTAFDGIAEVYQ